GTKGSSRRGSSGGARLLRSYSSSPPLSGDARPARIVQSARKDCRTRDAAVVTAELTQGGTSRPGCSAPKPWAEAPVRLGRRDVLLRKTSSYLCQTGVAWAPRSVGRSWPRHRGALQGIPGADIPGRRRRRLR